MGQTTRSEFSEFCDAVWETLHWGIKMNKQLRVGEKLTRTPQEVAPRRGRKEVARWTSVKGLASNLAFVIVFTVNCHTGSL